MSKLELTDKHGKVYLVEERCAEEQEIFSHRVKDMLLSEHNDGIKGLYFGSNAHIVGAGLAGARPDNLMFLWREDVAHLRDVLSEWLES